MTDEEKNILIRDISGRIDTDTFVKIVYAYPSSRNESFNHFIHVGDLADIKFGVYKEYKPYLRPMYTMSDSEKEQYDKLQKPFEKVDFLNKHHFDHRGMIDINLAIEATKDTYKL
jgi:hypothetical protein